MTQKLDRLYGWKEGETALSAEFQDGRLVARIEGVEHEYEILSVDGGLLRLRDRAGRGVHAFVAVRDREIWVQIDGHVHVLERRTRRRREGEGKGALGPIEAPMFGTVRKVLVAPDATVDEGQGLVILEAMKMELTLRAPAAARVGEVRCREGIQVDQGTPLVILVPLREEEKPPPQGTA